MALISGSQVSRFGFVVVWQVFRFVVGFVWGVSRFVLVEFFAKFVFFVVLGGLVVEEVFHLREWVLLRDRN